MTASRGPVPSSADLGALAARVTGRLAALDAADIPRRIWARDPTVWKPDPNTPEIRDRLGWLTVADAMRAELPRVVAFADQVRKAFRRVVLCGMGGSSLAPEVLRLTDRPRAGYPSLIVLDSTHPANVAAAGAGTPIADTFFLVSSKSGTTLEPDCFLRHFWEETDHQPTQFAAIPTRTPIRRAWPGWPLSAGSRAAFLNPPDIGGRYSALSLFGLVPGALFGLDVARLLDGASRMAAACGPTVAARDNPGAWLGAVLGEGALAGRDKATIIASPGVRSYGLWAEQLIAESTGKEGTGILPVAGEPLGTPDVYGSDRVFIALSLSNERDAASEARLAALAAAGHPVVRLTVADPDQLGAEFFRWEFATAVAGSVLGINAFDQPNVAESKANTDAVLAAGLTPRAPADQGALARVLRGRATGGLRGDTRLSALQPGARPPPRRRSARGPGPTPRGHDARLWPPLSAFDGAVPQRWPRPRPLPRNHGSHHRGPPDSGQAVHLRSARGGPSRGGPRRARTAWPSGGTAQPRTARARSVRALLTFAHKDPSMRLAMIGLGRMGGNMVSRLVSGGHEVVVFDRSPEAVRQHATGTVRAATDLADVTRQLSPPRIVWIMVPSGAPVEQTLDELLPHLARGDIVIDGGNSNFRDSQRRAARLGALWADRDGAKR